MKESLKEFLIALAIGVALILGTMGVVKGLIWSAEFSDQQVKNEAICAYKGGMYEDGICYKVDGTIDIEEGK